jgi:DNA-directed RNA polymerase subunit omega
VADRAPAAPLKSTMARVTVEDCLVCVPNVFTLTRIAAIRARQLSRGAVSKLPATSHKYTVTALREIACGHVTAAIFDEAEMPMAESPRYDFESLESIR